MLYYRLNVVLIMSVCYYYYYYYIWGKVAFYANGLLFWLYKFYEFISARI